MADVAKITLFVVDIGKTNLKANVLDETGAQLYNKTAPNRVINKKPYPHFNDAFIWEFIISAMQEAVCQHPISHICVATHGAAAALVNPNEKDTGLVMPIMDYEWDGVDEYADEYSKLRPSFYDSFSPNLPQGLNLGRQIHWQSKQWPDDFSRVKYILPLAQYWAWRLTGIAVSEVSALGCHTDLWEPQNEDFSSLVYSQNWQNKFPPFASAWSVLGPIHPDIYTITGMPKNCKILTGVHDSNASLARFLKRKNDQVPVIISTGTWTITMDSDGDVSSLGEQKDMLANVDVTGKPICCARFMGGREYAEICKQLGANLDGDCQVQDVQDIIDNDVFALPDFSNGSGPYGGHKSQIIGTPKSAHALASLYCAMMIDIELDLLGAEGPIVIEGSFADNTMICSLLSLMRSRQDVYRLQSDNGIAQGCLSLALWDHAFFPMPALTKCPKIKLDSFTFYRNLWQKHCNNPRRIKYA